MEYERVIDYEEIRKVIREVNNFQPTAGYNGNDELFDKVNYLAEISSKESQLFLPDEITFSIEKALERIAKIGEVV